MIKLNIIETIQLIFIIIYYEIWRMPHTKTRN